MFFDGTYASKRKVDLKGSSKRDLDKQAFLDKQKNERERRLQDKHKLKGAITIQAFYRGRSSVDRIKHAERVKWDHDIKTIHPNALAIVPLVRTLLFFFKESVDNDRLRVLCELILGNILKGPTTSYLGLCATPETRKLWLYQSKHLLNLCQRNLAGDVCYAKMLKTFTNLTVLEAIVGAEEAKRISTTILNHLIERGLFNFVRGIIASTSKRIEDKASILLLSLQRFNPVLPNPQEKMLAEFVSTIFSQPGIVEILKRKELEKEKNNFIALIVHAPTLLEHLHPKVDARLHCLVLACNLLELSGPLLEGGSENLQAYIKLLNYLLSSLPKSKNTEEDQEYQASHPPSPYMVKLYNSLNHFTTPTTLKRMFHTFLPLPSQVPHIPLKAPTSPPSFASIASAGLSTLASFVNIVTSPTLFPSQITTTSASHSIINSMSLGSDFVRTMWAVISSSREFEELVARGVVPRQQQPIFPSSFSSSPASITPFSSSPTFSAPSSSLSSSFGLSSSPFGSSFGTSPTSVQGAIATPALVTPDFEATVAMWARAFSQVLLTLDDSEFFEQQQYFKLDELRYMTSVLNRLVFRTYWGAGAPSAGSRYGALPKDESGLRTVLTTLLRQLYDRDARRSYCPEGHWTINVGATSDGATINPYDEKVATILHNIPFVIPFTERVKIFHQYIEQDKETIHMGYHDQRVTVRRSYIFEDGMKVFHMLGNGDDGKLKQRVRVEFVNAEGLTEAGVDGGGLFKDFITDLVKTVFDPQYALFLPTQDRKLYPNPSSSFLSSEHTEQFEFLGRILGKAMYESILVELPLANFFLAKILGKYNLVNDLIFLDPQLHKNLVMLKTYENVEDLALNFTVVDNEFGQAQVRELVPGGKDIAVTNENKIRYIYLVAHYRLNVQIKQQCDWFLRGFSELIKPEWVRMFNQAELQFLISGSPGGVNVNDFKTHTVYSGGYNAVHPTILMFWQVVSEMTPAEQRDLLKFVTSCSRPPLLGFGYLYPRFCIHVSRSDEMDIVDQYLPSASTCMNLLKLPQYSNKKALREKLLYAISSGAGFDLS